MWKMNISTLTWTQVAETDMDTIPGRALAAIWVDSSDNVWIYGGNDYLVVGGFNDIWVFRSSENAWSLVYGDDYGRLDPSYPDGMIVQY